MRERGDAGTAVKMFLALCCSPASLFCHRPVNVSLPVKRDFFQWPSQGAKDGIQTLPVTLKFQRLPENGITFLKRSRIIRS